MRGRDLGHDTLYIYENVNTYYTLSMASLIQSTIDAADMMNKSKLMFLGSSKAGYGAIICGRNFKPQGTVLRCSTLAFSPVTRVYPLSKPHPYKTFPAFLKAIESDSRMRDDATTYGHPPRIANSSEYKETVIFGAYAARDMREISVLVGHTENPGRFMQLRMLPTSAHNVISMYVADKSSLEEFRESCVNSASKDTEMPWLPSDSRSLDRDVAAIYESIKGETISTVISSAL